MPHVVDVTCPQCRGRARFEFVELCRIRLKRELPFFQSNPLFEYRRFQDSCGAYWHAALYFQGLHGDPRVALRELPDGYAPEDFAHSRYLTRGHGMDLGAIRCDRCGLRRKRELVWPDEAYYAVQYKGRLLWAFDRESAADLHDYLLSTGRDVDRYRWSGFLLRIPSVFKSAKARETVTRLLKRRLSESSA